MEEPAHHAIYHEKIKTLFEKLDFVRLARTLTLYTMRKHGKRAIVWREAEDYPIEAIVRTMDARRPFDFDGEKTIEEHLQSSIDSIVSHDLEKAARHVHLVDRGDVEEGKPLGGYDSSRIVADDRIESKVIEKVDIERHYATLAPDEQQYERLRDSGLCKTAKDFARHMSISETKVRNLERRRARRKRKTNEDDKRL